MPSSSIPQTGPPAAIVKQTGIASITRIGLTNVDSWLGCCTAYHLAEELEKKCKDVQLVCLARKIEHLDRLKKYKNVRLEKVDYDDENSLEKALRGVRCAILIPEVDERRAKYARNVLQAMKNQDVKSCMLISVEGAGESSSHLKEISSYHEIEKDVKQHCECYIILRASILDQCFLLWAPIVKKRAEFPISTTKQCEMVPIDVCDLVCAIETIVVNECRHGESLAEISSAQEQELSFSPSQPQPQQHQQADNEEEQQVDSNEYYGFGQHKNKIYTLTGPQKITPESLVHELSEVTGKQIEVKEVSREELKKYFESLKKRENMSDDFQDSEGHWCQWCSDLLASSSQYSAVTITSGDYQRDHDDHGDHHHIVPNEAAINLLLDELELIRKGEAGLVSGDLEKITGEHGKSIKDFLRKEKDAFKPHRD
ncbi:hypothetical protein EDD21DRAFT_446532 [Dissophora ornata]|nr:hypothetical protein EDD21DRAFT_446532 [Dissophora ornata]